VPDYAVDCECCGPNQCCQPPPAGELCGYVSAPGGCGVCMDKQVIHMPPAGGQWSRSAILSCGNLTLILLCDTTKTPPGCLNYKLIVSCGSDTVVVYPTSCTCQPFRLDFTGIALTSCCSDTISITITDICPPPDCFAQNWNCCCEQVTLVWKALSAGMGWGNSLYNQCVNLNHTFTLNAILQGDGSLFINPVQCGWRSETVVTDVATGAFAYYQLNYDRNFAGGPSWDINLVGGGGNPFWSQTYALSDHIPASEFNCTGPNFFNMELYTQPVPGSPLCAFSSPTLLVEPV